MNGFRSFSIFVHLYITLISINYLNLNSTKTTGFIDVSFNTIPALQGCFQPCNSKVGKMKLFFEFLCSETVSKFIPIHIIDIILLSVHLCTLQSVLKHVRSTLCNLYSFQAMRTCKMSKQGYFGVLSLSKQFPEGFCASVHVFCA